MCIPDDQIVLAHTNSMIILSLLAENDLSLSGNQTSLNCLNDKMLKFIKNKKRDYGKSCISSYTRIVRTP